MMPIGPLMIEHRLIEKIIPIIKEEREKIKQYQKVNPIIIDKTVDFFRMYADRTHHGKEEDILFQELEDKDLTVEHQEIMDELVEEHIWARNTVGKLLNAKESYTEGNIDAVKEVLDLLEELSEFYPKHIEKEDKHFFIPVMDYFTEEEQEKMLDEFWDFDKKLIHEKYEKVINELKG
ncbi:MAG: hemerythrin domain-containing protein [Promethearchaeati archaeon]